MISEVFASVLRSGRESFNAQFALARRQYPALDAGEFSDFLATCVDPLLGAVQAVRPECVPDVAVHAYETGLALAGQRLAGPGARHPEITAGWQRLGQAAAALIAEAPGRMLASVSNALHRLATTPGARPAQWLSEMELLAASAGTAENFLRMGQIVAWRSGLAHFRSGALAVAETLPEKLALAAVGAAPSADWSQLQVRLGADPWHIPGNGSAGLRLAGRAGAFRGFGGLFSEPPQVIPSHDDFLVRSGDGVWVLTANAFGATFHRAAAEEWPAPPPLRTVPEGLHVSGSTASWGGTRIELPVRGSIISTAATSTTLAVTSSESHAILLVALD